MSDPRFAKLKTDPRFRRPKKHHTKVVVDERFKEIFHDGKTKSKRPGSLVDKYGRALAHDHEKDNLRRFYRLEGNEPETDANIKPRADYARGELLLESSDEEDESALPEDEENDPDVITLGRDSSRPITLDDDIDLDENVFNDLEAEATAYTKNHPPEEDEGDRTRRIAVVNLDWDHVRAIHLYKILSSLVSPTAPNSVAPSAPADSRRQPSVTGSKTSVVRGKVLNVRVYVSDFGKERLAREEKEGPPAEVFKKKPYVDKEVNERTIYEVGEEDDYNENALRKYQLERLRYYYAIATCDTVEAASHIYSELDGTELERSANVLDLSFVPDDMHFNDDYRDEATEDTNYQYKGLEFVTDALRHSKVKLTWDEDDPQRNQMTRRPLTSQEIEDADFRAYLASSTSGSEADDPLSAKSETNLSKDKKAASRDALRALLLGGGVSDLPEGWDRESGDKGEGVGMEITFTPGLSEMTVEDKGETTLQAYQRKMKEKRAKRREKLKEKIAEKGGRKMSHVEDEFFDAGSGSEDEGKQIGRLRKEKDSKTSKDRDTLPEPSSRLHDELSPLASDIANAEAKHFNIKSILKAEKKPKFKRKKGKMDAEDNEIQEDFTINVKDDRFKALHEDHTFAIDPTNPHFKKTKGMVSLLQERSKRQASTRGDDEISIKVGSNTPQSLESLVASVKRKSAAVSERTGMDNLKRQKL